MPPRSSWKGFIRLSLVSVPVRAFTATATSGEVRLNQLHKESHQRIKYQKVVPDIGVIKPEDIVSGYEYAKGQYVVIDPDELDKLRKKSDHSINIDGFIRQEEIDPVYLAGKNYYLLPDGTVGQKPYKLLYDAMAEDDLCAIAQVVLSGREQLVMVRPVDDLLAMTVLTHATKVKGRDEFKDELEPAEYTPEELKLTKTLIDASRIAEFDYGSYKDEYVDKLKQLIELKVDGKEVVQVKDAEEPQIINFMQALKESVAEAQSASGKDPQKKMAPSAPAKKKAAKKSKKSG